MAVRSTPSGDESQFTAEGWRSNAKVRVAAIAARQRGRLRWDQLRAAGVSETTIRRWRDDGYLHRELPRVYAVGHPGRTPESDLAAALLYAGPGAALSHGTAIWWLGLLSYPPRETIHVSTPRRVKSRSAIAVHGERDLARIWRHGLTVTTPSRALLDFAAANPREDLLRLALANADYHGVLDLAALDELTGRGIAGSAALNQALEIHRPQLAYTRSDGERALLKLCERHHLPIPQFNVYLQGWLVDAVWPDARLVIEVDGVGGHRSPAQIRQDHRRDLELRRVGYRVLRYTLEQLTETPELVGEELSVHLAGELGAQPQNGLGVQLGHA
jgi:very-short-patch-repair endonuclease